MFNNVIVGLDGREHDAATLALGQTLRLALAGELLLTHVMSPTPAGRGMVEAEAIARRKGQRLLAEAAASVGDDVETLLVDPFPADDGLARLAAARGDSVLVIGSSHRSAVGRIVPGSTASRLLARAPCAIAVAPAGYAQREPAAILQIGVAYDNTEEADQALSAAAHAATKLHVPLRLYHAVHEISDDPSWDTFREHMHETARGILERGLEKLPSEAEATTVVLEGDAAPAIADAASTDNVGLLYVGSRGYGPLRAALFGGVAGALLQSARCPLIILPRGAKGSGPAR